MSSGNLTADRRFDYARSLRDEGDSAGAADVIGQALELAPAWPEGHFAWAEALADAGNVTGAAEAYRRYLVLEPEDSMGAALRLALLDAAPTPDAVPEAYVRRLFDEYASRFEAALVGRLNYSAPDKLRFAIDALMPGRQFDAALDLGCGTGLAGAAFCDITTWLEGIDIAPRMVAEAERKAIYQHLAVADMTAHLKAATRRFDLVIAADVLVYVGPLEALLEAAHAATADNAIFAFTVQRHAGDGFVLGAEHRYRHSRSYVETTAVAQGFDVLRLTDDVFRQEKGVDVPGLLVLLRRRSAPAY